MNIDKKNVMALSLGILIIYYISSIVENIFGEPWDFLSSVTYLLAPLMAAAFGFCGLKIFGNKSRQGKIILFLFLGMLSFFIAEILWVIYDSVLGLETTPSLADFFFLLAYPLFFIGLLKKVVSEDSNFSFKNNWKIIILGMIFIGLFSYFSIYASIQNVQEDFWTSIILMANGIGDLVLVLVLLFILVVVFEYEKGKLAYPWLLMAFAFFSMMAADLFYAIYNNQYDENLFLRITLDTLWILCYILFSFSIVRLVAIVKEKQEEIDAKLKEKNS